MVLGDQLLDRTCDLGGVHVDSFRDRLGSSLTNGVRRVGCRKAKVSAPTF